MSARSRFVWLILGGIAAILVLSLLALAGSMRWREAARMFDGYRVIAETKGWPYKSPEDSASILNFLRQNPETLTQLITHDNHDVRSAIFLPSREIKLSNRELDRLSSLFPTLPGYKQHNVTKMLEGQGPEGLKRLFALLENPDSLSSCPNLRQQLNDAAHQSAFEHWEMLTTIAANVKIPLDNRLVALETIGFVGDRASPILARLELLATEREPAIARGVRAAISRITNSPDVERLIDDLNWYRTNYPSYVSFVLFEVGKFGQSVHNCGPSVLKDLESPNTEACSIAAVTLALIEYREGIPQLIRALENPDDWRLAGGAAEALGRLQATEAEGALLKVTRTHWSPIVRSAAAKATAALHGKYTYKAALANFSDFAAYEIEFDPQHAINWPRTEPSLYAIWNWWWLRFTENLRVEYLSLTSPKVDLVKVALPDGRHSQEQIQDMPPRHRIRYGKGVLLGYDEGEFGAGLAYVPSQGSVIFYPIPNVTQLVRWQDKILVVTNSMEDNMIWLVQQGTDGIPEVKPFKRINLFRVSGTKDSHGNLNFADSLRLTPNGALEKI